jgi:hypothetical protein
MIMPHLLTLATLGDEVQIEMILSVSYHPRKPGIPRREFLWRDTADGFVNKLCQWKFGLGCLMVLNFNLF